MVVKSFEIKKDVIEIVTEGLKHKKLHHAKLYFFDSNGEELDKQVVKNLTVIKTETGNVFQIPLVKIPVDAMEVTVKLFDLHGDLRIKFSKLII